MKKTLVLAGVLSLASGMADAAGTYGVGLEARSVASSDKMCLDVKGDRQGESVPVIVWNCHGRENQRWALTEGEKGESAFVGVGGYCLDVRSASGKDGAQLELWRCHFGPNQRFRVTPDGLVKEVQTGKCIAPKELKEGAPVVLAECTDAKAKWHFQR
jgi:hypothetical protein